MKKILLLSCALVLLNGLTVNAEESVPTSDIDESVESIEETEYKDPFDPESYETIFEEDVYKIGTDMPAGEYKVFSVEDHASYTLTNDARGEDYVAYMSFDTFSYVSVEDDQFLELKNSFAIPVEDADPVVIENDIIDPGVYRIGIDIDPGEYKVTATDEHASYTITGDANMNDYIDYSSIEKSNYIEVLEGEYLELKNAEINLN